MNLNNKILYFSIAIAVVLTAVAILVYYLIVNEKEIEDVHELTAEETKEVLDSLSAPDENSLEQENNKLPEKEIQDILDSLSAPKN
jgi:hypothetical protein